MCMYFSTSNEHLDPKKRRVFRPKKKEEHLDKVGTTSTNSHNVMVRQKPSEIYLKRKTTQYTTKLHEI